jgi:CubicO group peptidase (beta-lactamase class C family)
MDLMTHTAGLSYGMLSAPLDKLYRENGINFLSTDQSLEQMVHLLSKLPLMSHPGEQYRYSLAYDVLGFFVQVVSLTELDCFLEQRVFGPLGVADTGFFVPQGKRHRIAKCYTVATSGKLMPDNTTPIPVSASERITSGGSGLFATAADWMKFCQMLANYGKVGNLVMLQPQTVRHLEKIQQQLGRPGVTDQPLSELGILGDRLMYDEVYGQSSEVLSSWNSLGFGGSSPLMISYNNSFAFVDHESSLQVVLMTTTIPTGRFPFMQALKKIIYKTRAEQLGTH